MGVIAKVLAAYSGPYPTPWSIKATTEKIGKGGRAAGTETVANSSFTSKYSSRRCLARCLAPLLVTPPEECCLTITAPRPVAEEQTGSWTGVLVVVECRLRVSGPAGWKRRRWVPVSRPVCPRVLPCPGAVGHWPTSALQQVQTVITPPQHIFKTFTLLSVLEINLLVLTYKNSCSPGGRPWFSKNNC